MRAVAPVSGDVAVAPRTLGRTILLRSGTVVGPSQQGRSRIRDLLIGAAGDL
jgi:hypothetical protein